MPIALYFGLFYGTSLSHNAVFSISTAALGGVSIIEYFLRFWRLWKKGKEPPIRLLAMPVSSLVFAFGVELLVVDVCRLLGVRAPVRVSSLKRGEPLRPGIYSIIEDVVAVDGSGGTAFRERLNARYEASHYFRQMLHRLTLFWAIAAL
ncbi:hypothetical protein LTR60_001839, partial [Cryomyces antarcticus]